MAHEPMSDEEMRKQAAQVGGGFTTKPTVERREIRPTEVVKLTSGERKVTGNTIYFPEVPHVSPFVRDSGMQVLSEQRHHEYTYAEHATRLWMIDHIETDVSNVEQPRIIEHGHWRAYVVSIWMPVEEYRALMVAREIEEADDD